MNLKLDLKQRDATWAIIQYRQWFIYTVTEQHCTVCTYTAVGRPFYTADEKTNYRSISIVSVNHYFESRCRLLRHPYSALILQPSSSTVRASAAAVHRPNWDCFTPMIRQTRVIAKHVRHYRHEYSKSSVSYSHEPFQTYSSGPILRLSIVGSCCR